MINYNKIYRNIHILESRNYFAQSDESYDPRTDLVLTFDFGLKREIEKLGGDILYIDLLLCPKEMQKNNFLAADFFKVWHYDKNGKDIFYDHSVSFGFSFRIAIWNEFLYYVRLRSNLEKLNNLKHTSVRLGESSQFLANILKSIGINFDTINPKEVKKNKSNVYYFDIHKYMRDAIRGEGIRGVARRLLVWLLSNTSFLIDRILNTRRRKIYVYAQHYHPTEKIIRELRKDNSLRVVTASLIPSKGLSKYFLQRLIPLNRPQIKYQHRASQILNESRYNRCAKLKLSSGSDISSEVHQIIETEVQKILPEALLVLDSVQKYLNRFPIHLEIMIANLGLNQTIVDCVLKTKGVPSFLIINGILSGKYGDEGKYAKYINGYSESIKINYFDNQQGVVCLGDPRMDYYAISNINNISRNSPTICIGTSGFNGINLISHVAAEFDFMFDILTAFQELNKEGNIFKIIIKVRPNGFIDQYKSFVSEYFPRLDIRLIQTMPIKEVLKKVDLYISIYSQTLFEASCLGIPVIYYKKDREYLDPPFDNKSELVTVDTIDSLKQAFHDFVKFNPRFDAFLDKTVMEKYIGPLDGMNLKRNLDFIYEILRNENN